MKKYDIKIFSAAVYGLLIMVWLYNTNFYKMGQVIGEEVSFTKVYSQLTGFKFDPNFRDIFRSGNSVIPALDYKNKYEVYFKSIGLNIKTPEKNKQLVMLQMPVRGNNLFKYKVKSIKLYDGELFVQLDNDGSEQVHIAEDFRGMFSYVIMLQVENKILSGNTMVNVTMPPMPIQNMKRNGSTNTR